MSTPSSIYFNRKHKHIRKDLQEHETPIFLQGQEVETSIKKQRSYLKESSQSLTKALKAHDEKCIWQNKKDNIIHNMQSEVDDIDSKIMSVIVKQEDNYHNKTTEIPQMIHAVKTLLDSEDT